MTGKARYAWTVVYRRSTWKNSKRRYFRRRPAAGRFVDKLRGGDYWELSPIVELTMEREQLGPIEIVYQWQRPDA